LEHTIIKAFAAAIDRESIVTNVTKGGQLPATAFVPGGIPDAEPGREFREVGGTYFEPYEPDKAKQYLAEAGYPNGEGFPEFVLLYNTSEGHKIIAEAIQGMWKDTLGITCTLTNQEWKVYLDNRTKLNYQIARAGWIGDYTDPMTFIDMWVTDGGNNDTGWSNPDYDSFVATAKGTGDQAVRMEAMHNAEDILMDEMPIIPIYFYTNLNLMRGAINHKLLKKRSGEKHEKIYYKSNIFNDTCALGCFITNLFFGKGNSWRSFYKRKKGS